MPITSATAMASLFFLLPGLLGLLVFEQVAEQHTKRSSFDKVIIAAAIALCSVAVSIEVSKSDPKASTLLKIQQALEAAGVEFTNGEAPGVRLMPTKRKR